MHLQGSCHCGNIRFTLDWGSTPEQIPARACDCSFCVKHGGVWTSSPTGSLRVQINDPSRHTRYGFGTRTAQFHLCSGCGVVPVVTSDIDAQTYAVVSVNALEDLDPARLARATASFGQEDVQARLARRATGWIPKVSFEDLR